MKKKSEMLLLFKTKRRYFIFVRVYRLPNLNLGHKTLLIKTQILDKF